MLIVLFEVTVKKNCMDKYLTLAGELREYLSKQEGFIRSERFLSLVDENKLLSLSVWENEEAVEKWRNLGEHRIKQGLGREDIFESYNITVTSPIRTYTKVDRSEAPKDSNIYFGFNW